MKQISKAIIEVMKAVKGMEKNSNVGTGKSQYNGTKDQDVKEIFNDALARNGLCILPIEIDDETKIERWEEEDQWSKSTPKAKKMKQSVFTKVKTKYLLLHESGESIELAGYGHGVDSQDKGAGKATTYALKNTLLYTFLTPVGKIDDTDTIHSNDISTPYYKPKQTPEEIAEQQREKDIVSFRSKIDKTLVTLLSLKVNKIHLVNSIKKHLDVDTIGDCRDLDKLKAFDEHCINKLKEKQGEN